MYALRLVSSGFVLFSWRACASELASERVGLGLARAFGSVWRSVRLYLPGTRLWDRQKPLITDGMFKEKKYDESNADVLNTVIENCKVKRTFEGHLQSWTGIKKPSH